LKSIYRLGSIRMAQITLCQCFKEYLSLLTHLYYICKHYGILYRMPNICT